MNFKISNCNQSAGDTKMWPHFHSSEQSLACADLPQNILALKCNKDYCFPFINQNDFKNLVVVTVF